MRGRRARVREGRTIVEDARWCQCSRRARALAKSAAFCDNARRWTRLAGASLTRERAMQRLFDAFERAGKELFLVGGAVRELARGVPMEAIDDLDFCSNARPQETIAILKRAGLTIYDVGAAFGTVGCVLYQAGTPGYPKDCQITTYRSEEFYRRGSRHPEVRYGDTLMQDLKRRDFSINSIAMDRDGQYIDPYDGLGDLKRGVLRVVSDPLETLAEDPLRILRVGRFISKLGFAPSASLREAAMERAEHILDISRERWLQEMTKLLKGPHAPAGLQFLYDVRVLGIILPEVAALVGQHETSEARHKDNWAHTLQVLSQAEPSDAQRWAALLHDVGKVGTRRVVAGEVTFWRHEQLSALLCEGIAQRFKFDSALAREVEHIARYHGRVSQYQSDWSDAAVRRLVRELDPYVASLLSFARADLTTGQAHKREEALARLDELSARLEAMTAAGELRPNLPGGIGRAIMEALKLSPSPAVGEAKSRLEELVLEGVLENGQDTEYYISYLKAHPPTTA